VVIANALAHGLTVGEALAALDRPERKPEVLLQILRSDVSPVVIEVSPE
jgi:hypothetical protein